ncbi:MAG: recombinase RecT [Gemmatimonadaceae bacterium]
MSAPGQATNSMALARQQLSSILLSDDAKRQIIPLLPHGVSLERVVSTIHQVVAENPEILECTPASIIMAVGKGVKQDLEFGETIHLVPFNVKVSKKGEPDRWEKRAKALRDWKGDIELVKGSGAARDVDAQCFYEKEHFIYHQGTSPFIEHHPIVDPAARGKMLGAYAWALISQRQPMKVVVMSVEEIDKIRQEKSKSWKQGEMPGWYARKTLIHQITKALPKNRKLAGVIQQFDAEDIPEAEYEIVAPAPETVTARAAADAPAPVTAAAAARPADDTPATEAQIARLLELIADEHVGQDVRDRVERRLKVGVKYGLADKWIAALELEIRTKLEAEGDELPLAGAGAR